ncbi:MAG: anaerobic glycerol-3-phosphate dehydrogenase subunit B [Desulfovibrio sp.]|nr:anaerobic glycerol-3-phosphate dehydrogenase subunit B [Desulfovibrio sp.]
MSKSTDVIVVGSGMAGLMAALAASKKGARVKVVSEGMGNLAISPGSIDVLGYDANGNRLATPWDGFAALAPEHPYSLLGREKVEESLKALVEAVAPTGLALDSGASGDTAANRLLPTIMGTFKPVWLADCGATQAQIDGAQKILVMSIRGFRDCRPQLIASQLRRYPGWQKRAIETLVLPAPFDEHGRSLNALDLAHFLDRPYGRDWFMNRVHGLGGKYDLALIPPILGAKPDSPIRNVVRSEFGCPVVELLSVPPGVSGLRLRRAFVDILIAANVELFENARAVSATVNGGKCEAVRLRSSGRETEQKADAFVIATGGIIGGGVILGQGSAHEAIFGLEIPVPADVDDWSSPEIFGSHLVSRLGVKVASDLRHAALRNVYFCGRTLGGYDYAVEKSGHGVACATGWLAGQLAATQGGV